MATFPIEPPVNKTLEARLAELETQNARSEYEKDVRDRIKSEILTYATRLTVSGLVSALFLLAGAGYLFIKSAVREVYEGQNRRVIAELRRDSLEKEETTLEWSRLHDYGKNYLYLVEFYAHSGIDEERRRAAIDRAFQTAESYFLQALLVNPEGATSYWELGELHYTYAHDYGETDWVNPEKALNYYQEALRTYSPADVARGWRADACRMIGRMLLEQAQRARGQEQATPLVEKAQEYLRQARDEYTRATPASHSTKTRLTEVDALLRTLAPRI